MNLNNEINIMTSSNTRLYPYILVQLETISLFFAKRKVNFFLMHHEIPDFLINELSSYCEELGNINFWNIYVEDKASFTELSKYGGYWPEEAYFSLLCHEYLPSFVTRLLYIDAGDVFFHGNYEVIEDFYHVDFDGALIVAFTLARDEEYRNSYRLFDGSVYNYPLNSGVYLMDVCSLRQENINMGYYLSVRDKCIQLQKNPRFCYYGDQELIDNVFAKRIKLYHGENNEPSFMPFNCRTNFFTGEFEPDYEISIIHVVKPKPWGKDSNGIIPWGKLKCYYEYWDNIYDKIMIKKCILPEFCLFNKEDPQLTYQKRSVDTLPSKYEVSKIILFGCSSQGQAIVGLFRRYGKKVHCFCDNDPIKQSIMFYDYKVISPCELKSLHETFGDDLLLVATVSKNSETEVLSCCQEITENVMSIDEVFKSFLLEENVTFE